MRVGLPKNSNQCSIYVSLQMPVWNNSANCLTIIYPENRAEQKASLECVLFRTDFKKEAA